MSHWPYHLEGRGWNSQYFSNHDQPRQISRFGDDGHYRVASAEMLGTSLHLLQGTPSNPAPGPSGETRPDRS